MFVFANNVNTTLSGSVSSAATTATLASTTGLPSLPAGDMLPIVFLDAATRSAREIVYVTNISGPTITIERAQEGTSALNWQIGDYVYSASTADSISPSDAVVAGDLTGTLPNPTIAAGAVTGAKIASATITGGNIAGSTITETNMAAGSIHQGQLSVATASTSIGMAANGAASYALVGGQYANWTVSANANYPEYIIFHDGGDIGPGVLEYVNASTNSSTNILWVWEQYVNSSPPYTEGPLFVYIGLNKKGDRTHICVAPDPTWAHHGPTSLIPHFKDAKGMGWRKVRMVDDVPCSLIARDPKHPLFGRYLKRDIREVPVKIDLAYKDSDRDLEPHPWHHTPSDTQFCLLEPGSDLMIRLHQIYQDSDADTVRKIVEEYVKIGDVTDKNAPKGMVIRKAKWRTA